MDMTDILIFVGTLSLWCLPCGIVGFLIAMGMEYDKRVVIARNINDCKHGYATNASLDLEKQFEKSSEVMRKHLRSSFHCAILFIILFFTKDLWVTLLLGACVLCVLAFFGSKLLLKAISFAYNINVNLPTVSFKSKGDD